jgi:hypothetical protein
MKIAEAEDGAHDGVVSTDYTKHRVWWGGMVLMALGEMGNFGAYFFAPASLVAPLGTVTVVANAIIAPVCLGEPFRRRDGRSPHCFPPSRQPHTCQDFSLDRTRFDMTTRHIFTLAYISRRPFHFRDRSPCLGFRCRADCGRSSRH